MSHKRRVFVDFSLLKKELSEEGPLKGEAPEETDSTELKEGSVFSLDEEQGHHLLNVLRLKSGELLSVVDRNTGTEYSAKLLDQHRTPSLQLGALTEEDPIERPVKSLSVALLKGKKNDLICEKACELGVKDLFFWTSERSVLRIRSAEEAQKKLARWNKICVEAAKQCGNNQPSRVHYAANAAELISTLKEAQSPEEQLLICSLSDEAEEARSLLPEYGSAHFVTGPEGDFSPAEEKLFKESSFKLVSLGPLTLKSETAALAAVIMFQALHK